MSSFPAYITQDEETLMTMANSNVEEKAETVTMKCAPKKLIQRDLHGNPVPDSFFKIKVSSYKKKNNKQVAKYSRKRPKKGQTKSVNKVSFKHLTSSNEACQKSVNLAFSLYLSDIKDEIKSIGRNRK